MSLLIFSIAVSFINAFLPSITKKISNHFTRRNETSTIRKEIEKIQAEMNTLSIKDEFPKYARLQRTLTKLVQEIKKEDESYKQKKLRLSYSIQYLVQGVMTILSLGMFWLFRFHPVIEFPDEWIYPLGHVLSWPTHSPGSISFPVWFLITNSVAKVVAGA
ncbi:unnamed protein product [Nezara viridula]|uniref:Guided entry of tail-anchored proteins factor 1 n=1 Tax=Nezara viridula TaxID=85310 RepID=A0A9P0MQL2_NEZVI|nr:unnamed protein product [Nezara viridula]